MRTSELNISAATFGCLQAAGINTTDDFKQYPCDVLLASPHFGPLEVYEIVRELNEHGLTLPPVPGGKTQVPSTPKYEVLRFRMIEGLTLAATGREVGLGTERVRQILFEQYGLKHQPPAVGARRRRETIERIWRSEPPT